MVFDFPTWTAFASDPQPQVSADLEGFDSWNNQGVSSPEPIDAIVPPRPGWLDHTILKSPWLYVEKATPDSHVGFLDLGDSRFVQTDGTCPLPTDHPALVLNKPSNSVHVFLEDITNTVHRKTLWDNWFSLKNSAPGGNGIKITSQQLPVTPPNSGGDGDKEFIPFCFPSVKDIDFFDTKYRLTVESVADEKDLGVVPWKDVMIIRPRPLCDTLSTF